MGQVKCKTCTPLLGSKNSYEISKLNSSVLLAHAWLYPFEQARNLIHISKFNGEFCHYRHQSVSLARAIKDIEVTSGLVFDICYVPTIAEHIRKRGFDHARVMAKKTALCTHKDLIDDLKALHNQSQVGKSRVERMNNPKFVCHSNLLGKNLILLDDVASTRSTLFHAAKALKTARAKNVIALTLSLNSK